jgi:hypothetical protein
MLSLSPFSFQTLQYKRYLRFDGKERLACNCRGYLSQMHLIVELSSVSAPTDWWWEMRVWDCEIIRHEMGASSTSRQSHRSQRPCRLAACPVVAKIYIRVCSSTGTRSNLRDFSNVFLSHDKVVLNGKLMMMLLVWSTGHFSAWIIFRLFLFSTLVFPRHRSL